MAPAQTTRLSVWTWSSNDDAFTRAQMTDSHQALEDLVALFTSGLFSARPAAAASNARGFYLATDTNVLYYSNGTAWFSVNSFASPVAIVPGDSITDGTSTFAARADHKHSLPAWGAVGNLQPVGLTASEGSNNTFARIDHRHIVGAGSVIPGSLALNSINAANLFTAQVVERDAIKDGAINKAKLDPQAQIPSGTIWAYGGTTAPTGWLFCDGQSLAVSAQTDLYNAIGYQYGGSGANFNVPDLRDRMPRGSSSTSSGLGVSAGSDTVTLAITNLPSHSHGVGTIGVATHAAHAHTVGSLAVASNALGTHTHGFGHSHGGVLDNGAVASSGAFGLFYIALGDGAYSGFFGGEGPQLDLGTAAVANTAITTTSQSVSTTGASPSLTHAHTISGSVANSTGDFSHTVSGTSAAVGSGTAVTVTPKTQTVNYIIKT